MIPRRVVLMGVLPLLLGATVASRRSRFGRVRIVERDGLRVLEEDGQPLSAIDPSDPERLVYPYLHLLASAAGPPGSALVVGVAGGTFSRWLLRQGFEVQGVEINRVTLRLARKHLGLEGVAVTVAEGRDFLETRDGPWDLVVLDASSEAYIPPSLLSLECFERVRAVLAPGGRALMNSWSSAPRADDELATWRAAFGAGWIVDDPAEVQTENRVLCSVRPEPGPFRVREMEDVGVVLRDP